MKARKVFAAILASALVVGMLPSAALAQEAGAETDIEAGAEATAETTAETDSDVRQVQIAVQTKDGAAEYTYDYVTGTQEENSEYTQIGDTDVYYKAAGEDALDLDGTLTARRSVSWDVLYKDAAGQEDAGFDVITTATTKSAVDGNTWNAYSELTADGQGTVIKGAKVPTKVEAREYVEAVILADAGKTEKGTVTEEIAELEQASTEDSGTTWAKSGFYYTAAEDGFTLTLPNTITTTPKSAEIIDSTPWGDYCIELADEDGKHYLKTGRMDTTEYEPGSADEAVLAGYQLGNKTMYAATFETSDGKVYTMGYLENMWSASYEFSFRVSADTPMTGMSESTNHEQYADLPGKTITKMTYYGAYGVYAYDLSGFDLKVTKKQAAEVTGDTSVSAERGQDAVINVDLSALTSAETYVLTSVTTGSGRNKVELGAENYAFDVAAGKVTIKAEAVSAEAYTLTFADANGEYASVTHSVAVTVTEPAPQTIAKASVSGIKNVYATGAAIVPNTVVKLGDKTLVKDTDYTVSVKNNKAPGTATVTITGKGAYTGTITKQFTIYAKKGASYQVGNYRYKVTNQSYNGSGTVAVTGLVKKGTSISIGNTVKIGKVSYKITEIAANAFKSNTKATKVTIGANVTTIGKNAFYNCKKVKSVTIKSKKLTSKTVKSKAFGKMGASNYKKVTVKVPSSKLKAYKKLLVNKGLSKKAKVKKA